MTRHTIILASLCCVTHLACVDTESVTDPVAFANYTANAWRVSHVDVHLGNVMYLHPDLGMYDREYTGVILTRDDATITLSYGGLLKQNPELIQLKVGDLVTINTDLDTLYHRPLDSYKLEDVVLELVTQLP